MNVSVDKIKHLLKKTSKVKSAHMAARTDESRHVLHNANNLHPSLSAEIYFLPHGAQRNFLRRSDDDGSIRVRPFEISDDAEMFV